MKDIVIIFGAEYLFLFIVAAAGVYFWRQDAERRKRIFLLACISLPLTYIAAKIGSFLYYDPRPFVTGNFMPLIPHAPDNGFPSDHTLISAAIASVILFSQKKLGLVLLLIAFLVGTSRVLAGVHSWIDIFGSIVIALCATCLANSALSRYRKVS